MREWLEMCRQNPEEPPGHAERGEDSSDRFFRWNDDSGNAASNPRLPLNALRNAISAGRLFGRTSSGAERRLPLHERIETEQGSGSTAWGQGGRRRNGGGQEAEEGSGGEVFRPSLDPAQIARGVAASVAQQARQAFGAGSRRRAAGPGMPRALPAVGPL